MWCILSSLQYIYAEFIVEGAPRSIQCAKEIRMNIYHHLVPPFEEIFDAAEEYILEVLFVAWSQMVMLDVTAFDKVCR